MHKQNVFLCWEPNWMSTDAEEATAADDGPVTGRIHNWNGIDEITGCAILVVAQFLIEDDKKRSVRRSCPPASPSGMELSQSWAEQLTFEQERSRADETEKLFPSSSSSSSLSLFPSFCHPLSFPSLFYLTLPPLTFLLGKHFIYWYIQLTCVVYTKRAMSVADGWCPHLDKHSYSSRQ